MLERVFEWIIETVHAWGYPGIVIMMAVESTILPFPSEAALIPAGFLASQGRMDPFMAIACGAIGSLVGATINYFVSMQLGRPIMERIGHYVLVTPDKLDAADRYFAQHGEITTFIGRLIPGIRHLISIPAGVARMNYPRFALYTTLGAAMWSTVLVGVGYWAGQNEDLWRPMLHKATLWLIGGIVVLVAVYVWRQRRQQASD
ncbi:MAG TPA: DedA family protein [Myxococcota bacterium]|nr:DedA family protein [Myxococcota bacterium]